MTFRSALVVASLAALTACASTGVIDTTSRERFTETAAVMANDLAPPAPLRPGEPLVLVVGEGPEPWLVHLEDSWDFCLKTARRCDEAVRRTLTQAFDHIRAEGAQGE